MEELIQELKTQTTCELRFDAISRRAYSVDASIYEVEPMGIIIPRTKDDLITSLKTAYKYHISVIPRGAATGITGGCLGTGLVLDLSKYLNKILEINYDAEYAIVEPGVVQDHLNSILASKGYHLGPETSTGNRATLGGMLANNSAGARSLRYGKMEDHVLGIELALADGSVMEMGPLDKASLEEVQRKNTREGTIYAEFDRIIAVNTDEIKRRFPHIPRRVSGYNLDAFISPDTFNLCKLIAGSEGSLGVAVKIKIKICKLPQAAVLSVIHFHDMLEAMRKIPEMLTFSPLSLEMIDCHIIEMGRQSPKLKGKLGWLEGNPQAVFAAEFDGATLAEAAEKGNAFLAAMSQNKIGYAHTLLKDPFQIASVWEIRKAGLGLLLSRRTYNRAIAFIEDLSIGPDQLASFMEKFLAYLKKVGKEAGIYGHVGPGCIHVRPYMDLRNKADLELMHAMMLVVSDLILEHGGALSGEHGDGLTRSWLNKKMFGQQIYNAFVKVKALFDPENLMNPGKIVHGPPLEQNLRANPETGMAKIDTFLDFTPEGGFELAADLCNGNAQCRKKEGVMCPSFQASGSEYDTTRARAQTLRAIINQKLPLDAFTSHALSDVLDLCLECKGCKTECPSHVDMAKMKAEFLYHYQEEHGYALRSLIFGNIGSLFSLGSHFPRLFNLAGNAFLSKLLFKWIGITPERSLPPLAMQTFSAWFARHTPNTSADGKKEVVLFNDTYNEFNEPHIGIAAVKVLEALDYKVLVLPWKCCGRPLISKGLLKQAKTKAEMAVSHLLPYAQRGVPIIGLEPSCILTIEDDYAGLLGARNQNARTVAEVCTTFDEFIHLHLKNGKLPLSFKPVSKCVKLHGHCHQKALVGTKPTMDILKEIPGFQAEEIDSGCCGMAGSFGYELEHYAISQKIGEQRLFPAVRTAEEGTLFVADGTSCRSQILHATHRKARHLAETLAEMIL